MFIDGQTVQMEVNRWIIVTTAVQSCDNAMIRPILVALTANSGWSSKLHFVVVLSKCLAR